MATTARQLESTAAPVEQVVYDDPQPIRLPRDWELTDERFHEIGRLNPGRLFERTADGRLHLMNFPDGLSESVTSRILGFVFNWMLEAGGEVRGEAGGYFLADESALAPDVSWVSPEQIVERGGISGQYYLVPPFAVEVMSPSQTLRAQQGKMRLWMDGGVRLGWLIDPYARQVWIYRANGEVEQLDSPGELSGEDVCVGLAIDMSRVWGDT
jgi:Uma2 family endonuclease